MSVMSSRKKMQIRKRLALSNAQRTLAQGAIEIVDKRNFREVVGHHGMNGLRQLTSARPLPPGCCAYGFAEPHKMMTIYPPVYAVRGKSL